MARYTLIDHTGDIAFALEADDWPGLLQLATRALGDVILEPADAPELPESLEAIAVEVEGADREDVLVGWLNEAVRLFDEEGFVPRAATFAHLDERAARGTLRGLRLDFEESEPDRIVKAATYHDLMVHPGTPSQPWRATVVLDL